MTASTPRKISAEHMVDVYKRNSQLKGEGCSLNGIWDNVDLFGEEK